MVLWTLVAILAVIIYVASNYFHSYWLRRNVPQKNPSFLVGTIGELFRGKKGIGEEFYDIYNQCKGQKVTGLYFLYRPALLVNDPEIVQNVMIKDFSSFHDRGVFCDEEVDPLPANLFSLEGQKWRDLRVKLSPVFTSGKLKGMFPTIRSSSKTLENYMMKNINNGTNTFDMRDLMARFTTNIISSVAFGIENDCINDRENIFRKMGMKIFETDFKQSLKFMANFLMPSILSFFKIKITFDEVEEFFMSIARQTIDHREKSKENERKDFMQLMIQLKNQGYLSVDKDDENDQNEKQFDTQKMTFTQLVSQSFLFFTAGFETSSSTTNFCLFEITKNSEVQKKVHEELDKVFKSCDINEVTYEMLNELKYLDFCIDEALRKYPIVPILNRECTKEYEIPDSDMTIEKGTPIIIPVLGLQRDPEIYDEPMKFIPERFLNSSNGNAKLKGVTYSPFGTGPHNCIGERMGKLQTKIGLATVLSKFKFEFVDKSYMSKEIDFDPKQFVLTPKQKIEYRALIR
ncbi:hypothetical protein PVAND_013713 [Polypedilum vanderplanki]|uniref:Cytochrome P450 n=1 Tax=Polypedilum vanderplanki TaxID=319348 RepID=A0A9J6CQJ3_POLVA|nr:hypothetical protein PVAND_013713 [Polypedilum vanderplanki]